MASPGDDASGVHALLDAARTATVATISAITQIALTIAYTSLVFRGALVGELQLGLTAMFAGLVVVAVVVAIRSDLPGHLAGPQDSGLVVISAMVPAVVVAADRPGPTVLVLMALATLSVGSTMFALGTLRLGRLIRYLPFPVMAGFLAGTGLVMGRATIELLDVGMDGDATLGGDRVLRFVIGGGTALAMVALSRSRLPTERVLPLFVVGVITTVHLGLAIGGVGRAEASSRALLLPELPAGSTATGASLRFAVDADWGVVVDQSVGLLPLLVLAPLTLLLYLGALEAVLDVDLDTDREFRIMGGVNLATAAAGAAPSYTQFAATMLVQRMARGNRIVPVVVGCSGVLVIALGDRVVALAPQPVVAGLLGFIALSFVVDWMWDTIGRMSAVEWVLAAAIAVSILVFGFLPGVALGIAATAAWFVVEYGRMSGVRRLREATHLRSNVERSDEDLRRLEETGGEVLVVEPEGFLFFGTGDSIARCITEHPVDVPTRFVVMDLSRVTGADSSAAAALTQLTRWARQHGVDVAWCGLRSPVRRALATIVDDAREFPDLDHALEWTEDARLGGGDTQPASIETASAPAPGLHDEIPELGLHARRIEFASGERMFTRGEPGPGLLVVESGWAEVIGAPGARRRRVGPGSVLGEIGLVHDGAATATVVADTDVVVSLLDRDAAAEMERRTPDAAAALYRWVARSLSRRLLRSDAEVAGFTYGEADATAAERIVRRS